MSDHFEILSAKLCEFLQYTMLLNMRAMSDITDEFVASAKVALADGYTLEKFRADCEKAAGRPMPEGDELFKIVTAWFNRAAKEQDKQ